MGWTVDEIMQLNAEQFVTVLYVYVGLSDISLYSMRWLYATPLKYASQTR